MGILPLYKNKNGDPPIISICKNKNGDISDAMNYRPVSLATIISKLFDLHLTIFGHDQARNHGGIQGQRPQFFCTPKCCCVQKNCFKHIKTKTLPT